MRKYQISNIKFQINTNYHWKLDSKHLKLEIPAKQAGYTLIELLVVLAIFAVLGSVIIATLFTSLRGANKTNTLVSVKQNGDYAISQMTKILRGAARINYANGCITHIDPNLPTPSPVPTGMISTVVITGLDGGVTALKCSYSSGGFIASNSSQLVNTGEVDVTACSMSCSQPTLVDNPVFTIQFTLAKKTTSNFFENQINNGGTNGITFQTSVVMRNSSE